MCLWLQQDQPKFHKGMEHLYTFASFSILARLTVQTCSVSIALKLVQLGGLKTLTKTL